MNATPSLLNRCLTVLCGERELTATERLYATETLARVLLENLEFQYAAQNELEYRKGRIPPVFTSNGSMTVRGLRHWLSSCPQDAPVGYVWDGAIRSDVKRLWLAENGKVALSDEGEYVTFDDVPVGLDVERYET